VRCVSIHPPIPTTFDEATISLTSQTSRRLGTFSQMDLTIRKLIPDRSTWGVGIHSCRPQSTQPSLTSTGPKFKADRSSPGKHPRSRHRDFDMEYPHFEYPCVGKCTLVCNNVAVKEPTDFASRGLALRIGSLRVCCLYNQLYHFNPIRCLSLQLGYFPSDMDYSRMEETWLRDFRIGGLVDCVA